MQLKSIDQCNVGMTVYNALWGKGEVQEIDRNNPSVFIAFVKYRGWFYEKILNPDPWRIENLYTEPVYICKKAVESRVFDGGGHLDRVIYEPVKTEQ